MILEQIEFTRKYKVDQKQNRRLHTLGVIYYNSDNIVKVFRERLFGGIGCVK